MTTLQQIIKRADEFDAKMAEVDRVDVWPACEFDRRYLLSLVERMRPYVEACGTKRMREPDALEYRALLEELK